MNVQVAPIQKAISISSGYLRTKRILDVSFSLLILIPLCIITVIAAILIRLDSAGPFFYRQKRVGLNGLEFTMLKFRSMYVGSDDALHRQAIANYMNGQNVNDDTATELSFKQVNDPRITRVGRFLRNSSIDELPQFFNVLRGEMTIVGPHPPIPYEVEHYSSRDRLRLCGKPGLTGPWQVYGRSKSLSDRGMRWFYSDSASRPAAEVALLE